MLGQPRFVNLFSKCHLAYSGIISGNRNTANKTDTSPHPYQEYFFLQGREKMSDIYGKKYIHI